MADQTDALTVLADLEAERAELDVAIAHLRRRLGLGPTNSESMLSSIAPTSITSRDAAVGRDSAIVTGRVREDEFFRLSNPEAIKKFLAIMKRPQSPRSIVEGLKAGGVLSTAKNFYGNIWTELKRMRERGEIVNTAAGWGLAEWYPQKPKQIDEAPAKKKKGKKRAAKKRAAKPEGPKLHVADSPTRKPGGAWTAFAAAQIHAGKTMKEAAALWEEEKKKRGASA